MVYRSSIATLGVVGTGVIGAGWAARALARGLDVVAWDPAPGAAQRLRAAIDNAWPAMSRLGLFPGASRDRLEFVSGLHALCVRADFIQESAPDRLPLKRELHTRLDDMAPPDVLLASSSSGLLPTEIQDGCKHPQRLLIGHPFNPVYLLPLVELVGGTDTAHEALQAAREFYLSIGMHPLLVRNEVEGYLSDRLQEALWRENLHLVNDGIATTRELDEAIIYGPGLRWAFMGVNQTFHLAGGDAGMRHMLEQFGPALELPWTRLKAPELTESLIDAMVDGTQTQAEGQTVKELERLRDDCLVGIMQTLRGFRMGAGNVLKRDFEQFSEQLAQARWASGDDIAAPMPVYQCDVSAAWIDYNGHMSAPFYPQAFDNAVEAMFQYFGHDEAYRDAGGGFFTAELHINYYRECHLGERLAFTAQIVGLDEKRLHVYTRMHDEESSEIRASSEQVFLHMDTEARKVAPIKPEMMRALQSIYEVHGKHPLPEDLGRRTGEKR